MPSRLSGRCARPLVPGRARVGLELGTDGTSGTGPVTTGPYRFVRHPIYLGLSLLAMGEALAFSSWPAAAVVFSAIVPTFVWRASTEEKLLTDMLGEQYAHYRKQTRMMIPYLL